MNEDRDIRHVMVNHPNPGFPSNRVSNTKYHWWSFVFVNLFEQLIQPMNAYYVIEACLELFPVITAYNPLTTWIPIIFIFTLTAIREAVEDIRRYKTDRKANQHLVRVLKGDLLVEVKSEDLQVGDIVYISFGPVFMVDLHDTSKKTRRFHVISFCYIPAETMEIVIFVPATLMANQI